MSLDSTSKMPNPSFSVKPAPQFESTALEIQSSPPLTSSLHSRNSSSSAHESEYLRKASLLRWLRLLLAVLLLGIGAAVVGCEAHVLHIYNSTNLASGFFLSLWPSNIDLRPTISTLVAGAAVIFTCLIYFLVTIIPSLRSRTLYLNIIFTLTSLLGLAATLFAVIYSTYLTTTLDPNVRENVHSWTCKWYNGANDFNADAMSLQLPLYQNITSPSGFGRLCHESEAAYGVVGAGLGVEMIAMVVACVGLSLEWRITKDRKGRQMGDEEKYINRPGVSKPWI